MISSEDIVSRLRMELHPLAGESADEINRLRLQVKDLTEERNAAWNMALEKAALSVEQFGVRDYDSSEVAFRIRSMKHKKIYSDINE